MSESDAALYAANQFNDQRKTDSALNNMLRSLMGEKQKATVSQRLKELFEVDDILAKQDAPINTVYDAKQQAMDNQIAMSLSSPLPKYEALDSNQENLSTAMINTNAPNTRVERSMNGGLMAFSPQARMQQGLMQTYRPPIRMKNGGFLELLAGTLSAAGDSITNFFSPQEIETLDSMPEEEANNIITSVLQQRPTKVSQSNIYADSDAMNQGYGLGGRRSLNPAEESELKIDPIDSDSYNLQTQLGPFDANREKYAENLIASGVNRSAVNSVINAIEGDVDPREFGITNYQTATSMDRDTAQRATKNLEEGIRPEGLIAASEIQAEVDPRLQAGAIQRQPGETVTYEGNKRIIPLTEEEIEYQERMKNLQRLTKTVLPVGVPSERDVERVLDAAKKTGRDVKSGVSKLSSLGKDVGSEVSKRMGGIYSDYNNKMEELGYPGDRALISGAKEVFSDEAALARSISDLEDSELRRKEAEKNKDVEQSPLSRAGDFLKGESYETNQQDLADELNDYFKQSWYEKSSATQRKYASAIQSKVKKLTRSQQKRLAEAIVVGEKFTTPNSIDKFFEDDPKKSNEDGTYKSEAGGLTVDEEGISSSDADVPPSVPPPKPVRQTSSNVQADQSDNEQAPKTEIVKAALKTDKPKSFINSLNQNDLFALASGLLGSTTLTAGLGKGLANLQESRKADAITKLAKEKLAETKRGNKILEKLKKQELKYNINALANKGQVTPTALLNYLATNEAAFAKTSAEFASTYPDIVFNSPEHQDLQRQKIAEIREMVRPGENLSLNSFPDTLIEDESSNLYSLVVDEK